MKRQTLKKILASGCFIAILAGMLWLFEMAVTDDLENSHRIKFHEFYHQEEIDTLILGASPALRGFNVQMMEEAGMENTFNLGTGGQVAIGGYYLLKEAVKLYDIDTVIYHTSSARFKTEDSIRPFNLEGNYALLDNMHFSINKLRLAYDALGEFAYVDVLSKWQRVKEDVTFDKMRTTLQKKFANEDYWNYYADTVFKRESKSGETYYYVGKGFEYQIENMEGERPIIRNKVDFLEDSEQFDYLEQTIELCQEKGIEFILVQVPSWPVEIYKDQEAHRKSEARFEEIAEKYQIPYWNFNYVKQQYFQMEAVDFNDVVHPAKAGSDKFTQFFMQVYEEYQQDQNAFEKYCYDSWEEWETEYSEIYGADLELALDHKDIRVDAITACAKNIELQYRYELFKDDADHMVEHTEWVDDDTWSFHTEGEGDYWILVYVRKTDSMEEYDAISRKGWVRICDNPDEIEVL